MSLRDLSDIKEGYDSGFDNILEDFYNPALAQARFYKRIAGFFSSSSLSVAARGIKGLVENNGHMDMLVSPRLTQQDAEMINKAEVDPESIISNCLCSELDNLDNFLQKKRIEGLGWLIANNYLKIKVATVYDEKGKIMNCEEVEETGLFHIKVGILEDAEGNIITFSGSVNETASAWVRNVEEFKVFKEWEPGQKEMARLDVEKFMRYWEGLSNRVKICDIPEAVSKKLIKDLPAKFQTIEKDIIEEEIKEKEDEVNGVKLNFTPFIYQEEALKVWQQNHRAVFEMATGTGKTKTAQVCIADFFTSLTKSGVVFVICPQDTLAKQWLNDIKESGLGTDNYVIADSSAPGWKSRLEVKLLELAVERQGRKNRLFVYSTFDTYCTPDFIRIIKENKGESTYFIIGDEVHGLGSVKRSKGFLDEYDYRLGLSATPERWFDEYGTKVITDYFGADRFTFTLHEALTKKNPKTGQTYLTPYEYIPRFVSLNIDELEKYKSLTNDIVRSLGRAKKDSLIAEKVERLMFLRADIHKSAEAKFDEFEKILDEIGNRNISDTIVFVSPGQIEGVMKILSRRKISAHEFTSKQGKENRAEYGGISEREHIIDVFKEGDYKVLVAMKCLDEGIDIPSAKRAIILASSTNPREYVQRIGRVIRRSPNKEKATIYDVIIEPSLDLLPEELAKQEKKIFRKEMARIEDISQNAVNRFDIIEEVYSRLG